MPVNGFNIGKDCALNVIDATHGAITFNLITSFTAKQKTKDQHIVGLDGVVRPLILPDGWEGSFELERSDSQVDDYFAANEAAYYSGKNIQSCTITETISEANGSLTQYRFTGVMLKLPDSGAWKGDASVKVKIDFFASRRLKVM